MEHTFTTPATDITKPNPMPVIILSVLLVLSLTFSAYLFYQNQQLHDQIALISEPKISEISNSRSDPDTDFTAGWHTYSKNSVGFTFKYPPQWELVEGTSEVDLIDPNSTYAFTISAYPNQDNIDQAWESLKSTGSEIVNTDSPMKIGNLTTIEHKIESLNQPSHTQYSLYARNTDVLYVIHFLTNNDERTKKIQQILSTFKYLDDSAATSTTVVNYTPGKDWRKMTNPTLNLTLCLPPKWDFQQNGDGSISGNLVYYRDEAYAPDITLIESIPYTSGSRREAYYRHWESEYPNVRERVTIKEININGNTALLVSPMYNPESKPSPEGMALVWYANGKLWDAGLSSWSYINESQSAFLRDFYTAISCSF